MSGPIPLWLDCDPGHDDVFAILLGAYHPGIRLLGISTVHGNAPMEKTTNNALSVLSAIGKDDAVRVYPGAAKALQRDAVHATAIRRGVGARRDGPAAGAGALGPRHLHARRRRHGGGATRAHVAGLSIMGGSVGGGFTPAVMGRVDDVDRVGNYSQWAEFNILIDPEAAAALLHDPVLAPQVDAHTPGSHPSQLKAKSKLRQMLVELLMFFAETYRDVFGIVEGPPLHDPLAVAAILTGTSHEIPFYDFDSTKSEGPARRERFEVRVVTEGTLEDAQVKNAQTGRTIARLLPSGEEGVRIPRGVDIELFWKVIEECCQRADEANARKAGTRE
ncbi:hypothetical protein CIB48_g6321 [Xylaria polymorpha]|nr:hypothetical protein CIB48_g6321 [Xylaria polymorpha]